MSTKNTPQANAQEAFAQTQTFMKEGFDLWQQMTVDYTKMVTEGTEFIVNQSLATREQMGQIMTDGFKKSQELAAKEQEIMMNNLDTMTSQAKASYERAGKIFTPAK